MNSNGTAAISVRGLTKHYDDVEAVRGIDFDVAPGEVFGFLGPNGAGKSTTISMLCTLTAPTAGTARIHGCDVVTQGSAVRRNIGVVFQDSTIDRYLTGEQNLRFQASLYGMSKQEGARRIKDLLDLVGLWERRSSLTDTYSGGMKRRLEIARGLLHSPRVLFLDEPTVGLDPQTRKAIWNYLRELREAEDITVFMTTHYMEEAEHCDRIAIMDHGVVIALDTPAALKAGVGEDRIHIHTGDGETVVAALRERFGIKAEVHDDVVTFSVPDGEVFIPQLFAGGGLPIDSVQMARPSLDDVFIKRTGFSLRDAESSGRPAGDARLRAMGRR
ncbi:ATP-binding cassette domain-containing protein [Nonomuraea sp. CA-218870]|uniref:ABC transporter ATP-binding protein n=1 Tax=Nonomuraea sp. CA-218870 TaxID=3239998 RepID=UPI003D940D47